jgi:hypothetical protein
MVLESVGETSLFLLPQILTLYVGRLKISLPLKVSRVSIPRSFHVNALFIRLVVRGEKPIRMDC